MSESLTGAPKAPTEDTTAKYQRQTRNAVVFIAWVVGIVAALSVIGGVIAIVNVVRVAHDLNTVSVNTSPTCSNDFNSPLPNC